MSWPHAIDWDESTITTPRRRELPLWRLLRDVGRALGQDDLVAHRYLLFLRFLLANTLAVALLGAAAAQGWIGAMFAADNGSYTLVIVAVFLSGLLWSGQRGFEISRRLNELEQFAHAPGTSPPDYLRSIQGRDAQSRAILASSLRLRLASRIAPIRHIANSLVLLGLIGTVIGFIIALSGVQPEAAADVGTIGPMVSTLIRGMSVALYTTLAGSVLHLWLMVNVRLLEGGTVKLLTATVELGERHAQF